jgi:hypothetical protein
MKCIFLFCSLFIISYNLIAQLAAPVSEDALSLPFPRSDYAQIVALSSGEVRDVYNKRTNTKVDGSPYLYDTWFNHSKIFFQDKVYTISTFNYNIFSDRFEAKLSKDSVFVIDPLNIKKVIINERVFNHYQDPESKKNAYFEELIDFDNYRMLRKYSIKTKSGTLNPLTREKLSNDKLVKIEDYYITDLNNNSFKKLKLKKLAFEALINKENLNKINKFIKDNDLKYTDIYDIIKILKYYNSL